jgi:hypothetical protein
VRPYSQKHAFQTREVLIQADSVRQIWGVEDPADQPE